MQAGFASDRYLLREHVGWGQQRRHIARLRPLRGTEAQVSVNPAVHGPYCCLISILLAHLGAVGKRLFSG